MRTMTTSNRQSVSESPMREVPHGPTNVPRTLYWEGDEHGALYLLDQTVLPHTVTHRRCETAQSVHFAIRELCVRGAPAIGVAAAYGVVLGVRDEASRPLDTFRAKIRSIVEYLESARPTAVNLSWAVRRMAAFAMEHVAREPAELLRAMLTEAHAMAAEDVSVCRRIGEHGASLVPDGGGVLTHCNAGALATVGWGTALSVLYVAHEQGKRFRVFADETRPLLQGARLTAFELSAAGLDVSVLCDGASAAMMRSGAIQMVVVGADRIAANGDTANKIGTYGVAVAAARHKIPFYVAAPRSTFDLSLRDGSGIPIEQRAEAEVRSGLGRDVVAQGVRCVNPAFDVTPAELIQGIITEQGVLQPVSEGVITKFFDSGGLQRGGDYV